MHGQQTLCLLQNLRLLRSFWPPKDITAEYIIKFVRAKMNTLESDIESMHRILDGKAEALEFNITDNSGITNIPLQQLRIKKNTLIGSIYRNGKVIFPRGQDKIMVGDTVMVVLSGYRLSDIEDILEVE